MEKEDVHNLIKRCNIDDKLVINYMLDCGDIYIEYNCNVN